MAPPLTQEQVAEAKRELDHLAAHKTLDGFIPSPSIQAQQAPPIQDLGVGPAIDAAPAIDDGQGEPRARPQGDAFPLPESEAEVRLWVAFLRPILRTSRSLAELEGRLCLTRAELAPWLAEAARLGLLVHRLPVKASIPEMVMLPKAHADLQAMRRAKLAETHADLLAFLAVPRLRAEVYAFVGKGGTGTHALLGQLVQVGLLYAGWQKSKRRFCTVQALLWEQPEPSDPPVVSSDHDPAQPPAKAAESRIGRPKGSITAKEQALREQTRLLLLEGLTTSQIFARMGGSYTMIARRVAILRKQDLTLPQETATGSNKEAVAKLMRQGLTVAEVADALGLKSTTVSQYIQRLRREDASIPNHKRAYVTGKRDQALELLAQGKRPAEVAALLHLSRQTVYQYASDANNAKP